MKAGTCIMSLYITTDIYMYDAITKMLNISPTETIEPKITKEFSWCYEIEECNVYLISEIEHKLMDFFAGKERIISEFSQKYNARISMVFVLYHPEIQIGIDFSSRFISFVSRCNASILVEQYDCIES